MKTRVKNAVQAIEQQVIAFASDLVKIKSLTGNEEKVIRRIATEMEQLGYDQVVIDKVGNVIGTIGNGPTKILFDSHVDHVDVTDPEAWAVSYTHLHWQTSRHRKVFWYRRRPVRS